MSIALRKRLPSPRLVQTSLEDRRVIGIPQSHIFVQNHANGFCLLRPAPNKETVRKFSRPILAYEDARLQVNFAAAFVGGDPKYPLSSSAPSLTPEQERALTVIQEAADRTSVRLDPEPGDVLFINNYALMHARGTWVDSVDDIWHQRYIMRLWLRDSEKGWVSASALQRHVDEDLDEFDLGPKEQGLLTGE